MTLEQHGFICCCLLDTPSLVPIGWTAELVTPTRGFEAQPVESVREPDTVRDMVLRLLEHHERPGSHELTASHGHAALGRLRNVSRRS